MDKAPNLQVVMQLAYQEALRMDADRIGTHHVLVGLLKEGGAAALILDRLGVDLRKVRDAMEQITDCPASQPQRWHVAHICGTVAETWQYDVDPPYIVEGK